MTEAEDETRLLCLQRQLAAIELLIIDELGFVPLTRPGTELLFELISQRFERGATIITPTPLSTNGTAPSAMSASPVRCPTGCRLTPQSLTTGLLRRPCESAAGRIR